MPASPSSSKKVSPNRSNTRTRRSTVSTAFSNKPSKAGESNAALLNSTVNSGQSNVSNNGSPNKSTSAKQSPQSRGDASLNKSSVVTMGTITDPTATASELLGTKSPQITQNTLQHSVSVSKSPISASKTTPFASGKGAAMPSTSSQAPGSVASNIPSGAPGDTKSPSSQPETSTSTPQQQQQPETSVAPKPEGSKMASSAAGAGAAGAPSGAGGMASTATGVLSRADVGHGLVDVTRRKGAWLEMIFSFLGALILAVLWWYMVGPAKCYQRDYWIFFTKAFSLGGVIACLFVLFHSCFDKRVIIGRGIFGCIIFFIVTIAAFLNIVDGFMAMDCICRCSSGSNAFSSKQTEDITIFALSLSGSFMLIAVLLVSSVTHE